MPSRQPATSFSKRIQDAASLEVLCRTPDSDLLRIEKRLCTQNDGGLGSKGAPLNFSFFRLARRRRFSVWALGSRSAWTNCLDRIEVIGANHMKVWKP